MFDELLLPENITVLRSLSVMSKVMGEASAEKAERVLETNHSP